MVSRDLRLKRLMYRSCYRGCKETDALLGRLARAHLHSFSEADVTVFEALLDENDTDIFHWFSGIAPVPERYRDILSRS